VLRTLADFDVTGHRVPGAPGIYVKLADPFGHGALGNDRPARIRSRGWERSRRWA
jgi:lipoyl(octanoyl) transferase